MKIYQLTYEVIHHYTFEIEASNEEEAFDKFEFDENKTTSQKFVEYNWISTGELE